MFPLSAGDGYKATYHGSATGAAFEISYNVLLPYESGQCSIPTEIEDTWVYLLICLDAFAGILEQCDEGGSSSDTFGGAYQPNECEEYRIDRVARKLLLCQLD